MAINKNFVIKNGVQVGTDLIVGDSDVKKVGIGTTIAGYTLHVAATNAGGRGGIGATDAVITGVGTIKDLLVTGFSGFSSDISVTGVVSARSFGIGTTEVIDRGLRLSGIASLDAITINTIEQAIRVGPNSFTDLKVTGISTFIGIATFSTGIDIKSGVSTFSAPLRLGFAHTTDHAGVALGATVGFGTSAFFRDDAAIFMGSDSDLKIHHDGSNSRIQDVGTGDLIIQGSADIKLQSASAENYIVANDTGSVDVYFDNSKKLETTSGGLKVTGITTFTDRLHVQSGISTFDDNAKLTFGTQGDLEIYHDSSNSYIRDQSGTGAVRIQTNQLDIINAANDEQLAKFLEDGAVELYFDNSKKVETTSGGLKVTGITTLTDRLHVEAGISTFDADVRFGIGATVGFGTSAFFRDDAAIFLGNDSDLKIHHDGSNSRIQDVGTGDLILQGSADIKLQSASAENYIVANDTGSVEIYYDNSKKLESTSGGLNVTGITTFSDRINVVSGVSTFQDNAKLTFGAQSDLIVYHSGSHSFIQDTTGTGNLYIDTNNLVVRNAAGDETALQTAENGAVFLYYDNNQTFQTTPQGVNVSGVTTSNRLNVTGIATVGTALSMADDVKARFGTGGDFVVYHSGSHGFVENDTGNLYIRAKAGENSIVATPDGAVNITYDDNTTFQTTPQGINVSGVTTSNRLNISGVSTFTSIGSNLIPDTDGSRNIGAAGSEWQDLHIDGTANIDTLDVDATSNFADDVTLVAAGSSTILFDASAHKIVFQDNIRANFGTSEDLSIYHDSLNSYVQNSGTGLLILQGNGTNAVSIRPTAGETGIAVEPNGSAKLYYDNSKKVETTSGGLNVTGITTISDRLQVTSGISTFYDTTQSTSATTGAVIINGGVGIAKNVNIGGNLTVTGTTTFNGGTITLGDADTDNVVFSADVDSNIIPDDDDNYDLGSSSKEWKDLYIDGTAYIDSLQVHASGSVSEGVDFRFNGTSSRDLFWDSSDGALEFNDDTKAVFGGSSDLSIYHDTSQATDVNVIKSEDNLQLQIRTDKLRVIDTDAGQDLIQANVDGSTVLFESGNKRLETVGVGVSVLGNFTVSGVNTSGDGNLSVAGISTFTGNIDANGDLDVDGTANLDNIDVDGTANFADDVTLVAAGSSTILFDASAHSLIFQDNIRAKFGTGSDLSVFHDGSHSFLTNSTGYLRLATGGSGVTINNADNSETMATFVKDGAVELYHNNSSRVTTTADGTDFGGTGSIRVPNGTTGERNSSPAAGDFRYNTSTGKFEGYTDEWGDIGGSGGVEETDTSVSTTSATSCGSFAIASFRSASIIAQITQGSNYQVGRYLVIHDGTTVTTIEESAVATGSMLGTFEGVINSSNLEFRVTMGSSSSATVTTKIDTVTV